MDQDVALFDIDAVRRLEAAALKGVGDPGLLMERAGQAAWRCVLAHWPQARRFAVVCGPGGNGGDGYVLARHLHEAGRDVVVIAAAAAVEASRHAAAIASRARYLQAAGAECAMPEAGARYDVVVDALYRIGFRGPLSADDRARVEWINAQLAPVLALDTPSGLDAHGVPAVDGGAVRARRTIEFLLRKAALRTGAALNHVGTLELADLDIDPSLLGSATPSAGLLDATCVSRWLQPRRRDTHKGDFGRVLCIGGDSGSGGAIALCAEAALRCGAGLVRVHTRAEHAHGLLARLPEAVVSTDDGAIDWGWPTVIALGPGLGTGERARALVHRVLASALPQVLDADALTVLAQATVADGAPASSPNADRVLTPHPGEAARLLGCSTSDVQRDRFGALAQLVDAHRCTVVLKGAGTLVGAPGRRPAVVACGNPGMATGGMGDVLTGVIGALLAQGLPAFDAARCGAVLHGAAGDAAAVQGPRGMLASDLMAPLRRLANPECT